jgi:glycine cleavage system transcriptional repressor
VSDFVVLTAVGRDRPGIVAAVAEVFWRAGCNVEDASMTLLRGEFAILLIARRPASLSTEALAADLRALESRADLQITLKELSEQESAPQAPTGRPYVVHVYGADREGILYRITRLLAERKINITDVNTRVLTQSQPPVWVMMVEIELPAGQEEAALAAALATAAGELSVDISLRAVDEEAL